MAHNNQVLAISNLNVNVGGRRVLYDIDLSVSRGEILVVLGPNGAGKSTLLKAIAGMIPISRGKIRINGRDVGVSATARQAIGVVPQQIALYEKLTAHENLTALGALMGLRRRRAWAKAGELLKQIGLDARANDLVARLSGGMRRRINIAAALMHDPSLVILDEPTVGLDFEAQSEVIRLLRALSAAGMAMILVTHDFEEAQVLAQRLAVLVGGRICALGPPEALVDAEFGNVVELELVLSRKFFDKGLSVDLLIEVGFRSDARGRTWSMRLDRQSALLSELLQAVASGELPVEQFTVQKMSLESLIEHHSGEHRESPSATGPK